MTETMTADALYAYAVVGPAGPEVRAALGPAFDLVGDDELAVVAGRVSLAEFGEDVLPKNLNDRPWLEAKAGELKRSRVFLILLAFIILFARSRTCVGVWLWRKTIL